MKIEHINIINGYLTAVYWTSNLGWRYTIFLQDGKPFQPNDYYRSSTEAYEVAKNIIELVTSCDRENTKSR